jgi:hypothetical protein
MANLDCLEALLLYSISLGSQLLMKVQSSVSFYFLALCIIKKTPVAGLMRGTGQHKRALSSYFSALDAK